MLSSSTVRPQLRSLERETRRPKQLLRRPHEELQFLQHRVYLPWRRWKVFQIGTVLSRSMRARFQDGYKVFFDDYM